VTWAGASAAAPSDTPAATADIAERGRRALNVVYFINGLMVMSWIPRFPQIRDGLEVSASTFGLLLSLGTLGALITTPVAGHLTHRFGTKVILRIGMVFTSGCLVAIVHAPSPRIFGLLCMALACAISLHIVSMNSHSIVVQTAVGRVVMGAFHGSWAVGSIFTGLITAVIAPMASPQLHISVMVLVLLPITLLLTRRLLPDPPSSAFPRQRGASSVPRMTRTPRRVWLLALGFAGASFTEFAAADWATIFAHDVLKMPVGRDGLLFTVMTAAIVIGRFSADRITARIGVERLVRWGCILMAAGMGIGPSASQALVDVDRELAFIVAAIGFFVAGLGTSAMSPIFTAAAALVKELPPSVTLARMAMVQQGLIWGLKALLAFTAGAASLHVALLLPAVFALLPLLVSRHLVPSARRFTFEGVKETRPIQ
jgi:MFS family permease